MSKDSGITLRFYKDSKDAPALQIEWGEEARSLLEGNGFSKIQMRIILSQHLENTHTPKYIKATILSLIEQLNYAAANGSEVIAKATKKRSYQQQYYRVLKKLAHQPQQESKEN